MKYKQKQKQMLHLPLPPPCPCPNPVIAAIHTPLIQSKRLLALSQKPFAPLLTSRVLTLPCCRGAVVFALYYVLHVNQKMTLQLVAAITVPVLFITGLSLLYGRSDPSDWCGWCDNISCVEFPVADPWWRCDDCSISGFSVSRLLQRPGTTTCSFVPSRNHLLLLLLFVTVYVFLFIHESNVDPVGSRTCTITHVTSLPRLSHA